MINIPGSVMIRRGTPDTIACLGGKFLGIEFKSGAKGKLSDDQHITAAGIVGAGGNMLDI